MNNKFESFIKNLDSNFVYKKRTIVKLNKFGKAEYAFELDDAGTLVKFHLPFWKKTNIITLPPPLIENFSLSSKDTKSKYLSGQIKISKDCFKNKGDLTLVLTSSSSISFEENCFDNGANIEFITPKNYAIKSVYVKSEGFFLYDLTSHLLLADKSITDNLKRVSTNNDEYLCMDRKIFSSTPNNIYISDKYVLENNKIVKNDITHFTSNETSPQK